MFTHKFIKNCILILTVALTLLPAFTNAQLTDSDNVQVNQQVNNGPSTPGGGGSSGSDTRPPKFLGVQVTPSENQAVINWTTDELANSQVMWGLSTDYSTGTLSNLNYQTEHMGLLTGLTSNTRYFFIITIADNAGNTSKYRGFFVTTNPIVDAEVPNVSDFVVRPTSNTMNLSWTDPDDEVFDSVRLLRSTKFYPLDPFNGEVVYEGKAQNFVDHDVKAGVVYYYTIFSVSTDGRYSSGSIGYGMIAWYSEPGQEQEPGIPIIDLEFFPSLQTPTLLLSAEDFTFSSGDDRKNLNPNAVQAYVGETLIISIPKDRLFSETTAITAKIIFADGQGTDSSYLFSYNKSTESYELIVPKFVVAGDNKLEIVIFDDQRKVLQKLIIPFQVLLEEQGYFGGLIKTESGSNSPSFYYFLLFILLILFLLILLIIILILLYRAIVKKRDKDRQES